MSDLAHLLVLAAIVVVATLSTMPDVFGLKTISFWQALKLLLIAGILFGPPSAIGYTSAGQPIAASESRE